MRRIWIGVLLVFGAASASGAAALAQDGERPSLIDCTAWYAIRNLDAQRGAGPDNGYSETLPRLIELAKAEILATGVSDEEGQALSRDAVKRLQAKAIEAAEAGETFVFNEAACLTYLNAEP